MNRLLSILTLFLPYATCIYEYIPGSLYESFAIHLHYIQKIELMKIIFNPRNSRSLALKKVQDWAHKQSPLTEEALDRAVFDHEHLIRSENREFFKRAENMSDNGRQLGINIRSILMNNDLSELRTCQAISDAISKAPKSAQTELGVEEIDCRDIFEQLRKIFDVIL